jgi:hypothetical protein
LSASGYWLLAASDWLDCANNLFIGIKQKFQTLLRSSCQLPAAFNVEHNLK